MKKFIPIGLGLLSSFLFLWQKSFSFDEAFSLSISSNPHMLTKLWNTEANMWLYYLLLHFWQIMGRNEFIIRSLSAIPAVLSIYVIYKLGEILFNKKVGFFASMLTSINLFFIYFAQEARSYSLLLLLTSLSNFSFIKLLKGSKAFGYLYIITTVLSFYTHFYAFFVFFAQILSAFLLFKTSWKKLLVCLIPFIFSLPIFIAPSFHSNQVNWIPPVSLTNLVGTFLVLSGDMLPILAIYGVLLLLLLLTKKTKNEIYLWIWLCLPIATAFLISLVKPIYQSVYFIICLTPFILLTGYSLARISKRWMTIGIFTLLFILSGVRATAWYTENESIKGIINNENENYRAAAKDVLQNAEKGDVTIFYGYFARTPFDIYGVDNTIEIASGPYADGGGSDLPDPNVSLIDSFRYPQGFVSVHSEEKEKRINAQISEIKNILKKHYYLVKRDDYFVVSVYEYSLKKPSLAVSYR